MIEVLRAKEYKPRPRYAVVGFMAGLCVCADNIKAAEGYLLELLACVAFDHVLEDIPMA